MLLIPVKSQFSIRKLKKRAVAELSIANLNFLKSSLFFFGNLLCGNFFEVGLLQLQFLSY
jgi:hypothetical protein